MRYALLATLLVGSILAAAGAVDAQQIRTPYRFIEQRQSLGVYGGYLITEPGEPEVGPQSAPIFGVRYNLRFSGPLSGEAAISLVPTNRQVLETDTAVYDPQPTGGEPSMNLLHAEVGLRFHLTGARTWNNLAPYVVATGGLASDLSDQAPEDQEVPEPQRFRFGTSFAVGFGLGTDFFVAERLSLRLEIRDHILRVRVPGGLRQDFREQTQWTNNFGFSLGTSIHF